MSDLSRDAPATVYEIINLKVFTALIEALAPDGERITRVCNNVASYVDTSIYNTLYHNVYLLVVF